MHQSGHERAQSMQTVQFSSLSAMTPRARGAGSSRSCGYCTVTAGFIIVRNVTPRPVSMPLISRFISLPLNSLPPAASERHLQYARQEDVQQRDRDEPLPRDRLQLVFSKTRIGEARPEHQERDEHHLGEEHRGPEEVGGGAVHPRNRPATEEKGGRERGERERGTELADEKEQEAKARVLEHLAGHELRFRDRRVARRLSELGL